MGRQSLFPYRREDVLRGTAYPSSGVSLKVTDEEFGELSNLNGIIPAPYVARYKWIFIVDTAVFNKQQWEHYIRQSYSLVKSKLPQKILAKLNKPGA